MEGHTPIIPIHVATESIRSYHKNVLPGATLYELRCCDKGHYETRACCCQIKRHSLLNSQLPLHLHVLTVHQYHIQTLLHACDADVPPFFNHEGLHT